MNAVSRRLFLAILVLAAARTAFAQTADDIIEKHLTALGGRAALAKVKSRSMKGTMTLTTPAGDVSGPVEILNEAPNKSRLLLKLDLTAFGAGQMTVDQRFDGTSGYVIDTMQGNRDIGGSQLDNMKNGAFPSPLLTYNDRGVTVELGGKQKVGDRDAYELVLKPKSGPVVHQFIDAESYLPIRVVVKVELPQVGELEQTTDFSDFRAVDGVKVPFMIKASSTVQRSTVTITSVEHNTPIDEALFSKPAAK
jgi:outer membrane lipoprotein-sorting protein